jgi:hypothetical protein
MKEKIFNCVCGASFIGTTKIFDQHLSFYCRVFAKALKILEKSGLASKK